jgi:hypothetical protein
VASGAFSECADDSCLVNSAVPLLVNSQAAIFFSPPEMFIGMVQDAGLRIERHFPHETMDEGLPQLSETRHDYLFRKN